MTGKRQGLVTRQEREWAALEARLEAAHQAWLKKQETKKEEAK
jgi:hypothetical protein